MTVRQTMRFALMACAMLSVNCGRPATGKTVMRIATWSGAGEDNEYFRLVNQIYRDFERDNPDIEIRIETMPGDEYVPKTMLTHIADVVPDVVILDASSSALFKKNGVLQDLTPFLEKDKAFSRDQFYENTMLAGADGNKQYSIPVDFTPMVIYYNKDLFDKAKVPYPKNGWTFEEFMETASKFGSIGKKGFVVSNWMPGWVMWLWNNGGNVLDPTGTKATGVLDSKQNIEAVQFLKDLVDKGYAPKLSEVAAAGVEPFANGDVAMGVSGHWSITTYKSSKEINWKRLGIVSMPTRLSAPTTVYYEAGLGIGNHCRNPEAAWRFIKHFCGYQNQLRYNASGIAVCARKDVSMERAKDPIEQEFLDLIKGARPPLGAEVQGYSFVEHEGQKMMDSVLNGRRTPAEALHDMAHRIDREFAK